VGVCALGLARAAERTGNLGPYAARELNRGDMNPILRVLLYILGVWVLAMGFTNSVYMAVSPRRWFDLPPWLRATGHLQRLRPSKRREYIDGAGGVRIRLAGAIMFFLLLYMLIQIFRAVYTSNHH
jgi:hypothetical protein